MILVIGGWSKIGSALIDLLLRQGEEVRALVRDSEGPIAGGVESVVGDLADPDSLVAAMSGAEKLFVQAHVVCDRYLQNSGLDHMILRPNLFQQNIPESTIPTIDANDNFYLNAGNARISMTDTRDIAAVAGVVLTQPGHEGAHNDVTGPEALSYADVAERLSATMNRLINYVDVPDEAAREALLGFGLDDWFVGSLVGLYQDYRRSGVDGYASRVTDTVERITRRPASSLDRLLSEITM